MTPTLSVVLVSYHSRDHLARCLPSLARQGVELGGAAGAAAGLARAAGALDAEVLVVDHAPGDGDGAWLAARYPRVRVLENPANPGYAGGNNLGLRNARGDWVLILNPDTELHDGALAELLRVARAHPDALVTPKLLRPDGRVNACGLSMHATGITACRALGEPADAHHGVTPVPLASGAAILARADVLRALGGFDERYFMYLEDADLSLRARARGHPVLCAADAVVTHDYALGMSPEKLYLLERNRALTLLKNLERRTLWRLAPALALTEAATWAFALLRGPRYLAARARAAAWPWRERATWRAARAEAQAGRTVGDAALLAGAAPALPFEQLVASRRLARVLTTMTTPLYRLAGPRFANPQDASPV